MPLHATTSLDSISLRLAEGPARWLAAAFSSIFVASGTGAMIMGIGVPLMITGGNLVGAETLFALPFAVIPLIIGVAHFSAGAGGVWQALREVRVRCTTTRLELVVSLAGLIPLKRIDVALRDVVAFTDEGQLKLVTEKGEFAISMKGVDKDEQEDLVEILAMACSKAGSGSGGSGPPEELLALVQRRQSARQ